MGDSLRDLIAAQVPTSGLITAAYLNARMSSMGRTRVLAQSPFYKLFDDTDVLTIRVTGPRSGHIFLIGEMGSSTRKTNTGKKTWDKMTANLSLDTPLGTHIGDTSVQTYSRTGKAYNPVGIYIGGFSRSAYSGEAASIIELSFTVSGDTDPAYSGSPSGYSRRWTLFEIPGQATEYGDWQAPGTSRGPLDGIYGAKYQPWEPRVTYLHRDEARGNTFLQPKLWNDQNVDYPGGVVMASRPYKIHSTTSTSYVTKMRCKADALNHSAVVCRGSIRGDGTTSVRLSIWDSTETTQDYIETTTALSTWDDFTLSTSISALPNNGDMRGEAAWIELEIKTSTGTCELGGAVVMNVITSSESWL